MYGVTVPASDREVSLLARRRRDAYTRSQTVATLPAVSHVIAGHATDGSTTRRSSRSSRGSTGSATDQLSAVIQSHIQGQAAAAFDASKTNSRRSSRRLVLLGRTPSSPSVLLNKVRDIIREKVFETSVDSGPDAAAVERERRQRAADAFEAQRRRLQRMSTTSSSGCGGGSWNQSTDESHGSNSNVVMRQTHSVVRRTRTRSDPARRPPSRPQSFDRDLEEAKTAFRQRSTSEEAYNHDVTGGIAIARGQGHSSMTRQKHQAGRCAAMTLTTAQCARWKYIFLHIDKILHCCFFIAKYFHALSSHICLCELHKATAFVVEKLRWLGSCVRAAIHTQPTLQTSPMSVFIEWRVYVLRWVKTKRSCRDPYSTVLRYRAGLWFSCSMTRVYITVAV